jgi:general L-amino acid transport system permease protein
MATTAYELAYVRGEEEPVLAPPPGEVGAIGWLRANLFSSIANTILTVVGLLLVALILPPIIRWAFIDAVWVGDRADCAAPEAGACWAFVRAKFAQFMYGRYPFAERWRVDITAILLVIGLIPMAVPRVPFKRENAIYLLVIFPIWAFILLVGGAPDLFQRLAFYVFVFAGLIAAALTITSVGKGFAVLAAAALAAGLVLSVLSYFVEAGPIEILGRSIDPIMAGIALSAALGLLIATAAATTAVGQRVLTTLFMIVSIGIALIAPLYLILHFGIALPRAETALWGGLLVTLVVAIVGMVASLPLGVILALGRRSRLPVIRFVSIVFIEFIRGVPLITVLFMASVMIPLFLPPGVNFDKLLRALIGVALFSSAYMAEVVRGGLQAIPRGQYEAGMALGLSYWKRMRFIILPQALKIVIPGIVNSFISLFKDTSLVLIIGIFDLLGIVQLNFSDSNWASQSIPATGYVFAAAVFWLFCFGMSRYSIYTERRLDTGYRR